MNPLLIPVAAIQGRRARSRIEMLPAASGPTTGTASSTGSATSADGPLRLIMLGESTAAGCGADNHEEAFVGSFARQLSARHDRPVEWSVHGRFGATVRRVRHRILPDVIDNHDDADVAVLLIGANDVMARTPVDRWSEDLAVVVDTLADRFRRVIVAGVPPFEQFPSLPRTLGRFLAEHGRAIDAASRRVCGAVPGATWVSSTDLGQTDASFFSADRFHPSPAGYRRWAEELDRRSAD